MFPSAEIFKALSFSSYIWALPFLPTLQSPVLQLWPETFALHHLETAHFGVGTAPCSAGMVAFSLLLSLCFLFTLLTFYFETSSLLILLDEDS